jgi:hypothetical protein
VFNLNIRASSRERATSVNEKEVGLRLIPEFQPHMHLRGKAMFVEAILPDGTVQTERYVGNFNFNWMTNYIYANDATPVFPKGTVIHVTSWYDNPRANPFNPGLDQ